MIKKLRLWLLRVSRWYRHRALYVIADATDNSITFSKALFDLMDVMKLDVAKVYVFKLFNVKSLSRELPLYAFAINPPFEQETQLADIQYNAKHKCIGFESLCPTVNKIFYDYGLPHNTKAKLSIDTGFLDVCDRDGKDGKDANPTHFKYYIILPPHDNTPA